MKTVFIDAGAMSLGLCKRFLKLPDVSFQTFDVLQIVNVFVMFLVIRFLGPSKSMRSGNSHSLVHFFAENKNNAFELLDLLHTF